MKVINKIFLILFFLFAFDCLANQSLVMEGEYNYICESDDNKTRFETSLHDDGKPKFTKIDTYNPNAFMHPPEGICETYDGYCGCGIFCDGGTGHQDWKIEFNQQTLKYKLFYFPEQIIQENSDNYYYVLLEEGSCKLLGKVNKSN